MNNKAPAALAAALLGLPLGCAPVAELGDSPELMPTSNGPSVQDAPGYSVVASSEWGLQDLLDAGGVTLPDDLDTDDGGHAFAILEDTEEGTSIVVVDVNGSPTHSIPLGYDASSISYDVESGAFLVSQSGMAERVSFVGDERVVFSSEFSCSWRSFWARMRALIGCDEYRAWWWSPRGERVDDLDYGTDLCWMDAADGPEFSEDSVAMLDVYGPLIAAWDGYGGTLEVIADDIGTSNILGRDLSGTYYTGGVRAGFTIVPVDGGSSILYPVPDVVRTLAIEAAGTESVYMLVEDDYGTSIRHVWSDGHSDTLLESSSRNWLDMVAL